MRSPWILALAAGAAWPASAHDFWLQPRTFWPVAGAAVPTTIEVGHGAARERWGVGADRVVMLRSASAAGVVDQKGNLRLGQPAEDVELAFATTGAHVVAFQSAPSESELPALRFNTYLQDEGLTPAIALRAKTRKTDSPGREIYSRRAKVLVQVGPAGAKDEAVITKPVGLTLEIVPERSPYALKAGESFPVRVLFEGRPLAGATVKLTNLDFDARPVETKLSDSSGRVAFDVPRTGSWLVNVIWTRPIAGNRKADFDTTFSSLTFGYPRGGMSKSIQ